MFLLVDRTNLRPLARHSSYLAVAALAYIQFANADTSIFRCGSDAQYGPLDNSELRAIAANMGAPLAGKGRKELIGPFRHLVETTPWLDLPFDVDHMRAQACLIEPEDARPYAFNPNGEAPDLLREWHYAPNKNRSRWECPHWVHFTTKTNQVQNTRQNSAGDWNPEDGDARLRRQKRNPRQAHNNDTENDQMATAKKAAKAPATPAKKTAGKAAPAAPAKAAKAAAPAKAEKAAKAPKAEKAARVEANGVKRPKAGSVGDKIWSTADTISAKTKKPATFGAVAEALGDAVNEASLRAGFQRWRKFNGLKGRAAAE